MSSSPHRSRGGGDDRPRFFDSKAKNLCWAKADIVPGRYPELTPPETLFASASATVKAASASSTITSFPFAKVVNPQQIIDKYYKLE